MKVAFSDRDGTIIRDYPDEEWTNVYAPKFIEGALHALEKIQSKGYQIVIITNQYIIGEEIITLTQYNDFTRKFVKTLTDNNICVLDIFYCPHARGEGCGCLKPATGLIDKAIEKFPDIDLAQSFIVGDSLSDVMMGSKLSIMTFGIGLDAELCEYKRIESLEEVVSFI